MTTCSIYHHNYRIPNGQSSSYFPRVCYRSIRIQYHHPSCWAMFGQYLGNTARRWPELRIKAREQPALDNSAPLQQSSSLISLAWYQKRGQRRTLPELRSMMSTTAEQASKRNPSSSLLSCIRPPCRHPFSQLK